MLSFLLTISDEKYNDKITEIYNKYHTDMLRYAKSFLKSRGRTDYLILAEDAVQYSFIKITKYAHKIDFSTPEARLKTYLLSIVTNACRDIMKENDIETLCLDYQYADEESFFETICIKERYDRVVQVIKTLDERYSLTLYYHYFEEMSVKDIAELMELNEKTVYTRLLRARKYLIELLGMESGND